MKLTKYKIKKNLKKKKTHKKKIGGAPITNNFKNIICTDSNIYQMVKEWIIDKNKAIQRYGFIGKWDVSNVTNMNSLFKNAENFNDELGEWNVSKVEDMESMFQNCKYFNSDISSWDTSNVKKIIYMFDGAENFNQEIGKWNISNVIDLEGLFGNAKSFNANINDWNVSKVESMLGTFNGAEKFNQPLYKWDVSKVVDMGYMFCRAYKFNSKINNWDISNVNDMSYMFQFAKSFNQDISQWNVENVDGFDYMFEGAKNFNQNLSKWKILNANFTMDMFKDCPIKEIYKCKKNLEIIPNLISEFPLSNSFISNFSNNLNNVNMKSIAVFIIGDEDGHKNSAYATYYMLKTRWNVDHYIIIDTNELFKNNINCQSYLDDTLDNINKNNYKQLYLFLYCHGDDFYYCRKKGDGGGEGFNREDLISIWNFYYKKWNCAFFVINSCGSNKLLEYAKQQNAKNIFVSICNIESQNFCSKVQLRIATSVFFSFIEASTLNSNDKRVITIKNMEKTLEIISNIWNNKTLKNINNSWINTINFISTDVEKSIIIDPFTNKDINSNMQEIASKGYKALLFWWITCPVELRTEIDTEWVKKYIKENYSKNNDILLSFYRDMNLLNTIEKIVPENNDRKSLIKKWCMQNK